MAARKAPAKLKKKKKAALRKPKREAIRIVDGNTMLKLMTVEKGEIEIPFSLLQSILKKNQGTPKKPLTKITLQNEKGELEEIHVLESYRKLDGRIEKLLKPVQPGQTPVLPKQHHKLVNRGNWYAELYKAVVSFGLEYNMAPNCLAFHSDTWEEMIVIMNTAPHRVEKVSLLSILPEFMRDAPMADEYCYWFYNEDESMNLLITINDFLKRAEFTLSYNPMGGAYMN